MTSDQEHPLTIDARSDGHGVVLTLVGELDPHTAPVLQAAVDALDVVQRSGVVVLDIAGLTFVDSSGLRVMIGAQRTLDDNGGRLVLRHPAETTMRLLEITGVVDHIDIER